MVAGAGCGRAGEATRQAGGDQRGLEGLTGLQMTLCWLWPGAIRGSRLLGSSGLREPSTERPGRGGAGTSVGGAGRRAEAGLGGASAGCPRSSSTLPPPQGQGRWRWAGF